MTQPDKPQCNNCHFGNRFNARPDEVERYGHAVMGCKLPGWEGYTQPHSICVGHAFKHKETPDAR